MFEQIIIDNSKQPIANLWKQATKAYEHPLTGIDKVSNKYVELVIKDCAKITRLYLPIMIYGDYDNPIKQLQGKFTKKDIIDVVGRSEKSLEVRQLLKIVLASIQKQQIDQQLITDDLSSVHETKDTIVESDNIYGDYEYCPSPKDTEEVIEDITNLSTKGMVNLLISIFKVK